MHRTQDSLLHIVRAAGHIQVAPCLKSFDSIIHSAPIGNDQAVKPPIGAKNIRQQHFAVTAMLAVDFIIGAHDRRRVTLLYSKLKGRQIDLAQRSLVHLTVAVHALIFLAVGCKMLERRACAGALHPTDKSSRHFPRRIGVFRQVFKISAAQGIPLDVAAGAEDQRHIRSQALLPDCRSLLGVQDFIPSGSCHHCRRETGGGEGFVDAYHIRFTLLAAQTVGTVRHHDCRYSVLLHFLCLPEIRACAKGDLILQGHPGDRFSDAHN